MRRRLAARGHAATRGRCHLRSSSYVVNVELLFTVWKLLWAVRGKQSRKAVSAQGAALA